MSSFPDGTELGSQDIIGRTLVEILQAPSVTENGLDWDYAFFRLDSGAVFWLPFEDAGKLYTEQPPVECTPQDYTELRPVLGKRIARVLRDGPDSETINEAPYLLMENGYLMTHIMGAYHGLGYAGIHIYAPSEIDTSSMIDFFP